MSKVIEKAKEAVHSIFKRRPPTIEENNGEQLVQRTALRIDSTERIRQIIRHELFRQQANEEAESFEEADDFDLPDGEEWVSSYEEKFEPEPELSTADQAAPAALKPPVDVPSGTSSDPAAPVPPQAGSVDEPPSK